MKRNLRALLAFMALLVLLGLMLHAFARKWYPLTDPAMIQANTNAQILVVGSSHAGCLQPDLFDVPLLNTYHNGADVFEMCYKIRYLTKRLSALSKVVIVLSPFTYFSDNAAYYRANYNGLAEIRMTIYARYPGWDLISSDFDNFIMGKLYPLVTADNWARCLYDDDSSVTKELHSAPELDEHARLRTRKMFDDKFRTMVAQYKGDLPQKSSALLEQTILNLQNRGIKVLLLTPPYWHRYTELLDPERAETAKALTAGISSRTGALYFDYSRDPRFAFSPEMFHDSDHLSAEGAAHFVPILLSDWNASTSRAAPGGKEN